MKKLRLFMAIGIPDPLKQKLAEVQRSLPGAHVKWVAPENFHLTLKFLGDTPVSQCPFLVERMRQAAEGTSAFDLTLKGVGTFPRQGRPRIVWAGIHGAVEKLLALQDDLEQRLENLGFPREKRPFSPHLTLGRTKEFGSTEALQQQILQLKQALFGSWPVASIQLMQSELRPSGPVYTLWDEVFLTKAGLKKGSLT